MSEEIKRRIIRVFVNLIVLSLIITASGLSLPSIVAIFTILPREGLSLSSFIMLVLISVSTFFALRILLDIIRLVDLASSFLIKSIPGLNDRKRVSIIRALKEVMLAFLFVLLSSIISPFLLLVPNFGPWLLFGVTIIILSISLFLIYDAGKTLYAIFESWIQTIVDKISK
ncbi:MAG: hypothetical protein QXI71_06860 [Candidatus Bathyarchaeia archaeon]